MACLFCLKQPNEGISIFGDSEVAQNARTIIRKHFWFDIDQINSIENYACSDCWLKVEAFHEFYEIVAAIYNKTSINDDEKTSFDSIFILDSLGLKAENEFETNFKNERKTVELFTPEYEADHFQNESSSGKTDIKTEKTFTETNKRSLRVCKSSPLSLILSSKGKSKVKTETKLRRNSKYVPKSDDGRKKKKRNVEKIICYICQHPVVRFRSLRIHIRLKHDPDESKEFECSVCKKKFSREADMNRHTYFHRTKEKNTEIRQKQTKCPICDKSLQSGSLRQHIHVIHEKKENKYIPLEDRFVCENCGKGFKFLSLLKSHASTHIDSKLTEVQCDICGSWLKNEFLLRKHMHRHVLSPVKCQFCGKIKANTKALQNHILIVHATPKHKCPHCEKAFTHPKTLREHVATHTGESLYNCQYCTKTFKNASNKYKHLRAQHLEQWNLERANKAR